MSLSQREATFNAISKVVTVTENVPTILSKEDKAKVKAILVEGFTNGDITISPDFDMTKINHYVGGLITNWINKDPKLNGNTKYVAKNPGSKAGSGDKTVTALKQLLKTLDATHPQRVEVQAALDKRIAEIKPKATVTIDADQLPEELRYLIPTK